MSEELKPCPLSHYVSAGLKTYKTGRDPHVICLDCGLSLAAPSWETVYERWNSRSPSNIEEVKALRDEALKGICVYCGHIEQYESLEQKAGEVDG